jgi:hypothetical protein
MHMTFVTSRKSVDFPKLNWGITAGETRELPEDKKAQAVILAHPAISKSKEKKPLTN